MNSATLGLLLSPFLFALLAAIYCEAAGRKVFPSIMRVWVRGKHRTRRVKPVKVAYAPKRHMVRGAA